MKKKKRVNKKKAVKIESPSFFWVFLLISFLAILIIGCAGSVENFASLNKTDSIIAGELPKTPWE